MQHGGISPVLCSQRSGMPDQKSCIFSLFAFIHFCGKFHLPGIAPFLLYRRRFSNCPYFCRQSPIIIPHLNSASSYKTTCHDLTGNNLHLSTNIFYQIHGYRIRMGCCAKDPKSIAIQRFRVHLKADVQILSGTAKALAGSASNRTSIFRLLSAPLSVVGV